MKLVDFLVEELHKFGGWPDGMVKAWQSNVDTEVYFVDDKNVTTNEVRRLYRKMINKKSDDMGLENAVTRSEYESALAAKNDGWINWNGGDCPLAKGDLIDFRLRGGGIHENLVVGEIIGERWTHSDSYHRASCDIIAYRLHKPEVKAAEWNGEGLPPIGVDVEYIFPNASYRMEFSRGKVLSYGREKVFMEHWSSKNEFIQPIADIKFRPLRTEAERKRDVIVKSMMRFANTDEKRMSDASYINCASIYEAIANGKIEGVKLEDN